MFLYSLLLVVGVEVFGVPSDVNATVNEYASLREDSIKRRARRRDTRFEVPVQEQINDEIKTRKNDSTQKLGSDTLHNDTTKRTRKKFIDAPIFGKNRDSLVYDVKNKQIFVHGDGDIKYDKLGIKAEYIRMGTQDKIIVAKGTYVDAKDAVSASSSANSGGKLPFKYNPQDSNAKVYLRPVFTEGQTTYDLDSVNYNMDSQKALIKGVDTKDAEGSIFGGVMKKMPDNVIHMHNGRYTTCDAECKHFYLQMTKATHVQNKKTVFGPSYLVFEDVPIYFLGLPFGFFPQMGERNSGFIIPEIGEETVKGFFLRNGGYYLVFNDNIDMQLTAGIYTLGSWEANLASNYYKRYKFGGGIQVNYASNVIGEQGSTDYVNSTSLRVMWQHRQDQKASPGSTFSASVNFSTSSYNKFNAQNLNDYLNTQTNSSVSYQKTWLGTPFSLTANGTLSQDMRDTVYQFNLPNINFNVNRVTPFRRKVATGKEKWYEKIGFTYNLAFQNNTGRVKEKDLFSKKMFDNMAFGIKHELPIDATFNLFQYLNITPNVRYSERWYFRQINQSWDKENNKVVADTTRGFYRLPEYSVSLNFSTILYGSYALGRKGAIQFRHVMSPNISFSFSPGFNQFYGSYENSKGQQQIYSPFQSEMYGVPSMNRSASINFGVNNTLEMKAPSKTDTSGVKKYKLIEGFSINSSYNFAVDSLNLAPFNVSIRATLFKGLSLQGTAIFDPYQVDDNNRRINKFQIHAGGLARLTSFSTSLNYGFQSKQSNNKGNQSAINNPKNNNNAQNMVAQQNGFFNQDTPQPSQVEMARMAATQYYDFQIPWSVSFQYTFAYSKPYHQVSLTNAISFNGSINITPKWGVSFGAGYDFVMKKITPGTIQISRDLHCWQMNFSWIPVGYRQSWSFSIRAKASMLADLLKWDKNNSYLDNRYGY